jgi:hypothetical protein
MNNITRAVRGFSLFAAVAGLAAAATPLVAAIGANDPILRLAGRWAGPGSVVPASGPSQVYTCVVTYFPGADGARLKQNLRCRNGDTKLEASTLLEFEGGRVRGTWEDKVNSLGGSVTGAVTDSGFDIHLGGQFFQAKMVVVGSACEQQVKLTPVRADYIREMAATLKKC